MYGGIVYGAYPAEYVERRSGLISLGLKLPDPLLEGLTIGASVALDGVCLTVTAIERDASGETERGGTIVRFDAMQQTLATTTLGEVQSADLLNVERSLSQGQEVGGHMVSGHVDGMAEVVGLEQPENNHVLTVKLPTDWMKYVFPKGYLALDGCSLTAAEVDKKTGHVTVYLIPETLRRTSFRDKKIGHMINFEVDRNTQVLVDTVTDFLTSLVDKKGISAEQVRALQEGPRVLESEEPEGA